MTERDPSRDQLDRLTVAQAAKRLGITEAGVRKRVQRGQIRHERDEAKRLWVWVSADKDSHAQSRDRDAQSRDTHSRDELVAELRNRIEDLRSQLDQANQAQAEQRATILALTSRIPEIEAPASPETRESDVSPGPSESATPDPAEAHEATERRWWEFWR